jgi:hypothetical protein
MGETYCGEVQHFAPDRDSGQSQYEGFVGGDQEKLADS